MASSYTVRNRTVFPIWVSMDTDREQHLIQPAGSAIFVKANPLDRPTFKAYAVAGSGERGSLLAAKKASYWQALWAEGTFTFNGTSF